MTHSPGWQPRYDDPLFILAMDHRASFGKTLFGVTNTGPRPDQAAAMKSAKGMIFEGLRAALPALTRGRLAQVSAELARIGVPLLYELLVPATAAQRDRAGRDAGAYDRDIRPGLVTQVITDNQAHGVEPTLWKVEGLETAEAARQVAEQARAGGRDTDLIVLGRDARAERLDHWLEVASQVSAFVGFAIGRSIWEDAVRGYEASDRGTAAASAARAQVTDRYLGFVARWNPQP